MKIILGIVLSLAFFLAAAEHCLAQDDSFGIVKSVSGEVVIASTQRSITALPNMKISQGDSVKTGSEGSVGLIFTDDTVVALGPNSEMKIESLLFNPVDLELSFVARLFKGTFSFITGQIAKLAPKNVKFETPEATLGVRGTKLLVEID
jgi:hypothetical protein